MFKGFFIITLISLFFVACDCVTHKSGLILDSQTGEPIQGANIMYIANRRDSSKFNGCSPLQLHLGLIGLKPAIAYLPYTQRCLQIHLF
jgi:hypothetical protein